MTICNSRVGAYSRGGGLFREGRQFEDLRYTTFQAQIVFYKSASLIASLVGANWLERIGWSELAGAVQGNKLLL